MVYADKAEAGNRYKHLKVASKPYPKRYGHYELKAEIKTII